MANTHETTADLIAWLRRPREGENAYLTAWRDEIADRLEAAWKREKAAIEADALAVGGMVEAERKRELSKNMSKNGADFGQLGDAAKLREALDYVRGMVGLFCNEERISYDEWQGCDDMISSALSAPPRNCDVYTSDELKVKFKSELASELPIANEHEKNLIAITAMGVIDTLLAPATEKEGGAK